MPHKSPSLVTVFPIQNCQEPGDSRGLPIFRPSNQSLDPAVPQPLTMVTRASSCGMIVDYLPSSYTTTFPSGKIFYGLKWIMLKGKKHIAILVLPELKPQTQQLETKLSVDSMHLTLDITPGLLAFSCEHKAPGPTTLRLRSVYSSTPGLRLNRCYRGPQQKTQNRHRVLTHFFLRYSKSNWHMSGILPPIEVFFEVLDSS